jgi:hypothetical protein
MNGGLYFSCMSTPPEMLRWNIGGAGGISMTGTSTSSIGRFQSTPAVVAGTVAAGRATVDALATMVGTTTAGRAAIDAPTEGTMGWTKPVAADALATAFSILVADMVEQ